MYELAIKLELEDVKGFIEGEEGNGCKLLSEEYLGSTEKLQIKCACGKVFSTSFSQFKNHNRKQCRKCGIELRRKFFQTPYEDVKYYIEVESDSGCKLISKTYKNANELIELQCKCGNNFMTRLSTFKSLNKRQCDQCSMKNSINLRTKTHEQFLSDIEKVHGKDKFTFLQEYNGDKTKILVRHNICGYERMVTPNGLLSGNECPLCGNANRSKGENKIKDILEKYNINFTRQYKFEDCKNTLQLPFDFAIHDYNNNLVCLIEYHGRQHYEAINFFGGKKGFEYRKHNDNIKLNYCKKNNIKLFTIPYWDFFNLEEILNKIINFKESEMITHVALFN